MSTTDTDTVTEACQCGCSTTSQVTNAEPCSCGCACCEQASTPAEEVAELRRVRAEIDRRLAELEASD